MIVEEIFALTETHKNEELWQQLIKQKLSESNYAEFSLLYGKNKLNESIKELNIDLVDKIKIDHKIYAKVVRWRYKLTEQVSEFITSKKYSDWLNYQFEDLSLLNDERTVLATITHENYIFIATNEIEKEHYNKKGFEFGELFKL